MAETAPLKRQREETHVGVEEDLVVGEDPKRQKTYNHILSLLEAEEEIPTQDLSSLMSTLEHEISFDLVGFTSSETTTTDPENPSTASDLSSSSSTADVTSLKEEEEEEEEDVDEEDDKESVIRHLLEASDDELGIPQAEVVRYNRNIDDGDQEVDEINGGGDLFFSVCDGLWEFEDEAANYYTYLQSQLFM